MTCYNHHHAYIVASNVFPLSPLLFSFPELCSSNSSTNASSHFDVHSHFFSLAVSNPIPHPGTARYRLASLTIWLGAADGPHL